MTARPRSLQGRLLVMVLGTVVTVWALTVTATWLDVRHELGELLDGHLAQAAALLVVQQGHEVAEGDHDLDAPTLHRYAPKVAFQVFHEGRLALRSANAPVQPMIKHGATFPAGFSSVLINGAEWRVFAAQGGESDIQVFVGEQVDSRAAILRAVLRSTLWPMLLALPLLSLAAWWSVSRGLAPLRWLGRVLAARQPHALQAVQVDNAPAEMVPVLDALNSLFSRIGALMESERRFTADAAHELRTPIAAIRAQAQVALGEADDAARQHALQATLAGCDRATRLVEQLLTLSRLEADDRSTLAPLALDALARRVVAELAPQAIAKRQTIEVNAAVACAVRCDATLAAVLVRNLVDNAIRYSPPSARVHVGVQPDPSGTRLTVEDSGPALAPVDLQRLGERFFRVIGSGEGGSGLGWSIVRRIAAVHGAAIVIGRSAALGGLSVTVTWRAEPVSNGPPSTHGG